jgi:hypothetical protein
MTRQTGQPQTALRTATTRRRRAGRTTMGPAGDCPLSSAERAASLRSRRALWRPGREYETGSLCRGGDPAPAAANRRHTNCQLASLAASARRPGR